MKTLCFVGMTSLLLAGCGGLSPMEFVDLPQRQPAVLAVNPADGATEFENNVVEVRFSQPIDPSTVTAKSFTVTALPDGNPDINKLWEGVDDEKIKGAEGSYEISGDGTVIRFVAENNFNSATRWGILLTPEILSMEHIPLNQTPGTGPTPFFSSFYSKQNLSPFQPDLRPAYLSLNEIFYDAVGADTNGNLFVELYGEPLKEIGSYQLIMINGSDGKTVGSVKIPFGSKIAEDGLFTLPLDPPNGPDCMQLLNERGGILDEVGYGSPQSCSTVLAPDASSGKSIVRKNKEEWIVLDVPTPGFLDFQENIEQNADQEE